MMKPLPSRSDETLLRRLVGGRPFAGALAVLLLSSLLAAPAAFGLAAEAPVMVGADGELLRVLNGPYGELFPDGTDAAPDASVLALDVSWGETAERVLVPGTETFWAESSPRLIADERAGVSYLLWEARVNGVHPLLKVVSFDGGTPGQGMWGEVKEITASVFSSKGEPRLRVTHDSSGEGEATVERTVLHVSWWEDHSSIKKKRYASVILENGLSADADVVVDLSRMLADPEGVPAAPSPLDTVVRMQAGPHKDVVVMGFVDSASGGMAGLQVEVLPQALSRLADRLKAELEALPENAGVQAARGAVQRAIGDLSEDFHAVGLELIRQDLLGYLDELLGAAPGDVPLPIKMGGRVIWIGAKIGRTGLENPGEPQLLEIEGAEGRTHHLAVTRVASWEVPETGSSPRLFLSQDGSAALVAWLDSEAQAVHYRTSLEDGSWSEVKSLGLEPGLGQADAFRLLENKALDR